MHEINKKLIEVALPLEAINDASAYDKMPGIGPHPKGIHHWWARLPLPCARAMLFASLVNDPSSDPKWANKPESEQDQERERLFEVIRVLLNKRVQDHPDLFKKAHIEIVNSCGGKVPVILDPFCGGGSIPLEAQRLGMNARGTDLNPVAVLVTKAAIELVPKFANHPAVNPKARAQLINPTAWKSGKGLSDDVRYYADLIQTRAAKRLGHLYPRMMVPKDQGGGEAKVVAWLWTRTVKCQNPACGAMLPLVRSFVLASKSGNRTWSEPVVERSHTPPVIAFAVRSGSGTPPTGTVTRRGGKCISCREPISFDEISAAARSGNLRPRLLAIVASGKRGRLYFSPSAEQERAALIDIPEDAPDTNLPEKALGFRIQRYGMLKHRDLFTPRQLTTLTMLSNLVKEVHKEIVNDAGGDAKATEYADAISLFLSFAVDRCVDFNNSLCRWSASNEKVMNLFGRHVIPMVWDFAEANTLGDVVGGWSTCSGYVADCIDAISIWSAVPAEASQIDAVAAANGGSGLVVSTDPPYYDNMGYADLSDVFYVWLRRSVGESFRQICSTVLVPKQPELVAAPERFEGDERVAKEHFVSGFRKVFMSLRTKLDDRFPMTVYYAFKQADEENSDDDDSVETVSSTGWETMLEALISSGFQITGTWPVRASQAWRMRAMGSNALASYIVLACRPLSPNAQLTTRRELIASLKRELPDALRKLKQGNVAPVDLAQAAIGPGMAVFSRYAKVLESDGTAMPVRTALSIINEALDQVLAEQEGEFDADTRWAVTWFDQHGFYEGPFGEAETLSKAKDTSVNGMVQAGILTARSGKVRLLKRDELPPDWDPIHDRRLTVWEVTQQLVKALEQHGEQGAAVLLRKVGSFGDTARDLAYRLYIICERRKWAQEATPYNSLITAWPEIAKLAVGEPTATASQARLGY